MRQALIVDDSRAIRMILKRQLAGCGFEVSEAADGQAGLNTAKTLTSLDLAMLDVNMPIMDGFELLKEMRADPQFEEAKIVMVTTEIGAEQMIAALEAGANDYIMKPFTDEVIAEKLLLLGL
jgi:two-component system, chemotaxis family, chemotaxis protein CheY